MQVETRRASGNETEVSLPQAIKRRVRTDAGRLSREAERRRNRANAMVVASIVGVLVFVRLLYSLLTR